MKKILFYPGTFNPPHLGHVSLVTNALASANFDEVWIMPSGKRIDKEILTSFRDRKNMSILLVEYLQSIVKIPVKLIADAVEEGNEKFTHEIIVDLKARSKDEIYQLTGIDGFLGIKERVIGPNEKFVVVKRAGFDFPESMTPNENFIILEEQVEGISSTLIRELVKNGDSKYRKMVPNKVAEYIEDKGLFA